MIIYNQKNVGKNFLPFIKVSTIAFALQWHGQTLKGNTHISQNRHATTCDLNLTTNTTNTVFPITTLGTSVIAWKYTDAFGNTTTQTQDVIIEDTTAPIPDTALLTDIFATCEVLQAGVTVPTATDGCSAVTVSSDAAFPINAQGTTVITWTYTDANGNATTQTHNVIIDDTLSPTFTLSDLTVSVDILGTVLITAHQLENGNSSDNCGIAAMTVTPDVFTCDELGVHIVTVKVTDVHGNAATAKANLKVTYPNQFCEALSVSNNDYISFLLYPNPTANMLYVQPGHHEVVRNASLYSISGQMVFKVAFKKLRKDIAFPSSRWKKELIS